MAAITQQYANALWGRRQTFVAKAPAVVIPQLGFDIVDTRSYPVLFVPISRPLLYDRKTYPVGSAAPIPLVFGGSRAPVTYED